MSIDTHRMVLHHISHFIYISSNNSEAACYHQEAQLGCFKERKNLNDVERNEKGTLPDRSISRKKGWKNCISNKHIHENFILK